jgi:hypothetical protein
MNDHSDTWRPGRSCPLHYRYSPSVFSREADLRADTLYVVGGLYGNRPALGTILDMLSGEHGSTALLFNGDFNWFNSDDSGFEAINTAVLSHRALRGNVETELASDDAGAGCGCGYPDSVPEADVDRSNQILERLRGTARRFPELRGRLGELPMHAVAQIGGVRVGIVHGDAESLAGWQFDVSSLDDPGQRAHLRDIFTSAQVDVFASSHTCLPVLREFSFEHGNRWVINNGAAGMPNFKGTQFGLLTRISIHPSASHSSLYGIKTKGAFVDALPIRYDPARWVDEFLSNWAPGSPGHASYYERIANGPAYPTGRATQGASPALS